ncbi:MAG: type II secretion system F family protein [Candidatus Omnitrophica bacterium]|nr:type II secretion system F family protein [Candidatus Omnitrophota bacterium]
MSTYHYTARDKNGKFQEGLMTADTEKAVAVQLQHQGYIPVTIERRAAAGRLRQWWDRGPKIKASDLNIFTRLLFTLQKAGLPLLSSLNALGAQITNQSLQETIKGLARDIESGASLSAALEKHPEVFDDLYVSMVRSGETAGRLAEILERLAVLGEHDEKVRLRVKSAVKYPVIIVSGIILGFIIMVTLVIPRFQTVYGQFMHALPLPTRVLLGVNSLVVHFWWLIVLSVILGVYIFRNFTSTREGLRWLDRTKLTLPFFGPLLLKLSMSRFCRVMATLLRSGIPILHILDLVSDTIGNVVVAETIEKIKKSVNEGGGMLAPMRESGLFPAVVTQMVAAGEETGKLDDLLTHVADYYDSEVDYTLDNFISLIEPVLIVVLGGGVLFMALGVFLPMWSLMDIFDK